MLHEIRVLRVDLGPRASPDDDLAALPEWHCLSEDERIRGLRFVRPRDRRRFVICRGSLRMILGRLLTITPDRVVFRSGPGGKPELASTGDHAGPRPPRFNVTHSDDLALIAMSLDRELGVDLERERTISEADRIVESYFTDAEKSQYVGLGQAGSSGGVPPGLDPQGGHPQGPGSGSGRAGLPVRDDVRHHAARSKVHPGISSSQGSGMVALGGSPARFLCRGSRRRGFSEQATSRCPGDASTSDLSLRGLPVDP